MKLCARHINELIRILKVKGLWHRVDTSPAAVQDRTRKWLNGVSTPAEIDPLVISVMEINRKAVETVGNTITMVKANGEHHCPLCEVNRFLKQNADISWLDNCTDAMVSLFLQNGIPRKVER